MEAAPESTAIRREIRGLILLALIALAAFFVTRMVARANEERRRADADTWSARAGGALGDGQAGQAAQHLRRAVALDPSNVEYRLQLAGALTAARADDEARRALLDVLRREPQNARVNLALGRLESKEGDVGAVVNYYQAALNQMWRADDAADRYKVRKELAQYLLSRDQRSHALSYLLILTADMPDTARAHEDVGRLLLDAGDPARALAQFDRAIQLDPRNQALRLAAGEAALALDDYTRALRHLRAAPDQPRARDLESTIALVLSTDPLLPRLSTAERVRRLGTGLAQARLRMNACASPAPPTGAQAATTALATELDRFEASLAGPGRRGGVPVAERLDDGVDLVRRIEEQTADCGPQTPLDRALVLIGRRHEAR